MRKWYFVFALVLTMCAAASFFMWKPQDRDWGMFWLGLLLGLSIGAVGNVVATGLTNDIQEVSRRKKYNRFAGDCVAHNR